MSAPKTHPIPINEIRLGDSLGKILQLIIAPETGTKNLNIFNSDTLTPSTWIKKNQIEKATAETSANQTKAI